MTDEERAAFPDGWEAFTDPGFIAHVGPVYHRTVAGTKEFAFRTDERHGNFVGIVHGGMLLTFADRALSIVVRDACDGARAVTIEMSSAAQIGDLIETVPEIVRKTASLVFVRGTLTSGGRPLAAVTGIWKVLKDRPGDKS
jgi:acyl-coenzyme A thioesterase PaaI-like protein